MDLSVRSELYQGLTDRSWLQNAEGIEANVPVALDISKFTAGTHYPNGVIPAGTVLGKVTATGKYGPYAGNANEVQTVGLGAASAGTVTLTVLGKTTGAIAFNANAAAIQAALVAAGVAATDVVVTGAFPTLATFTFGGVQSGIDESAIVCTPTGLTGGGVAVVEATKGGSLVTDGRQVAAGILYDDEQVIYRFPDFTSTEILAPMFRDGYVIRANLPANSGIDNLAVEQLAPGGAAGTEIHIV